MPSRLELEFDNPADALVFLRLAELAEGVRIVDEQTQIPPQHHASAAQASSPMPSQSNIPPPTTHPQNPDSEAMKELDDMLPDWFK